MNSRIRNTAMVVAATGAVAVRKVLERAPSGWPGTPTVDPERWRVVTVYRPIEEIEPALPEPLAELGDAVEIRLTTAPGDKGTEVAARLRRTGRNEPSVEDLRRALREAKQLLEVGYVLEPDRNSTTQPTGLNAGLRKATAGARGEGRL
ncbi:hypothetical protein [Kribbella sp. CA-293567]|uniref:hypothetical protein n=1 Tax=Kribbella sp. CA-293567 TaxID=3002436 RepID=UPI0022DDF4B7|nr:hypothetical protein [Kribbella sp. CA-293567]WBQ08361.1 hypothetical protein OX958_16470 [Kribbella sp. CA-293567]